MLRCSVCRNKLVKIVKLTEDGQYSGNITFVCENPECWKFIKVSKAWKVINGNIDYDYQSSRITEKYKQDKVNKYEK